MNTILRTVLLAVVSVLGLHAQTAPNYSTLGQVHRIPFASQGNVIELAVANSSTVATENIRVSVQNASAWLQFAQTEQAIGSIAAGEEGLATFVFSADKSAPVGQEQTLSFIITNSKGESWMKEIRITISAPETFELFQNYPNPFNPTTVIRYQLPVDSRVSLRIYNLLGQEVAFLVNGDRKAGFHQETFNARGLASGLYVYQLGAHNNDGNRKSMRRAMLLVK